MFMGEESASEAIYLRSPVVRVSRGDSIHTGSGAEQKGTGILRNEPPDAPPVNLHGLKKEMLYGINSGAAAKDVPLHLGQGMQLPGLPMDEVIRIMFQNNLDLFRFKVTDELADKLEYISDMEYFTARREAFYDCFKVLFRKHFVYNKTFDREDQFFLLLYGDPAATSIMDQSNFKWNDFSTEDIGVDERQPEFIDKGSDFDKI